MPRKLENLPFTVDEWDEAGNLVQYHARAKTFAIGKAAYEATIQSERWLHITLRHGAQVLAERKAVKWHPEPTPPQAETP